ncbi:MAG: hypothetical protein OIN88_13035 [Candidatus Methanoperedens sp.]|nr:hypothetical protein [Candidatus Methanoperedens sp.]MCZ7360204.1 hypothetical protein [Candidatus Methanoperedens sp.]HLB72089.1 zinc-ribbon domain-containing protein [Candidatus Methanoperedens sp.]
MLEQESFWNAQSFAVITDSTKPAMKWTVDELTKKGKKVYVVDMSGRCPICDKTPPSGIDTLECRNCNTVIPSTAKFCDKCGAAQPE